MRNDLFNLALLGFSPTDHALISSLCKISGHRAQHSAMQGVASYQIIEPSVDTTVDIVLINADDGTALQASKELVGNNPSIAMITVSKSPQEPTNAAEHTLARHRVGGRLLKLLDQIVEQPKPVEARDPAPPNQRRKSCLVVDDSHLVCTQMQLLLEEYDLDLSLAESAERALEMIIIGSFDIIFLDVMLPEMDGYKACKRIKSNPLTRATPVVMLTSKSSPFNKMHGALVGCDSYLTKPVDPKRIHQALEKYAVIGPASEQLSCTLAAV